MTTADAGTGRLSQGLVDRAATIIFGATADAAVEAELPYVTAIDEAHLVMLAERRLVDAGRAAALLGEIAALRAADFRPLCGAPAPRGVYLRYESHLIERLGVDIGGVLHTGRSRNDLKATMQHMRARECALEVLRGLSRLLALLLSKARRHRTTVMSVYSQFQPATPASYGYYLLGVAESLARDVIGLLAACDGLRECPLGAASGAGTDVAIDPARTAALLGFAEPVRHAAYAVAARDTAARLLSAAVLAALTLSRLSTDLQLWSTPQFGLIDFPDSLVGSSSAMPQKRNPFLLEHIKGSAGALIGAWTSAVTTMKNVPFGNSVEVTTDAMAVLWPAMARLADTGQLAISVVAGARPEPAAMLRDAERGFTAATALANRLVAQGVPFRAAHHAVGAAITELVADGACALTDVVGPALQRRLALLLGSLGTPADVRVTGADVDPAAVVTATDFGGGPGPASFAAAHSRLVETWRDCMRRVTSWSERLRAADHARAAAVHALRGRGPSR